jgi:hypothetical protein
MGSIRGQVFSFEDVPLLDYDRSSVMKIGYHMSVSAFRIIVLCGEPAQWTAGQGSQIDIGK